MKNQRPILLTGASGFIGRSFCEFLFEKNPDRKIITLVRTSCELPENVTQILIKNWELPYLLENLKDQDFSTIFHFAAYGVSPNQRDLSQIFSVNIMLSVLMTELAKEKDAALITAGSCSEYSSFSAQNNLITEDTPLQTQALYGSSKAAGWLASSASAVSLNIAYTHLRLFNVYGLYEADHRLLPSLIRALTTNKRISLSDGDQIRDFIHIEDVCRAFLKAEETSLDPGKPNVFNVCTGRGHSVREFAETVCSILDANVELLGFGDIPRRPDDVPVLVGDPAILNGKLNFACQLELRDGLTLLCNQFTK